MNIGPPIDRGLRAVDGYRGERQLSELEHLDEESKQRTNFANGDGLDRDPLGTACGLDLEAGIIRERSANRIQVAALSRGVKLSHQAVNLGVVHQIAVFFAVRFQLRLDSAIWLPIV